MAGKLEEIFERHGEVSDIVMRQQGKKKGKASAFVEMATLAGAAAAAQAQNGSPDAPLLVVPFHKVRTGSQTPFFPRPFNKVCPGFQT